MSPRKIAARNQIRLEHNTIFVDWICRPHAVDAEAPSDAGSWKLTGEAGLLKALASALQPRRVYTDNCGSEPARRSQHFISPRASAQRSSGGSRLSIAACCSSCSALPKPLAHRAPANPPHSRRAWMNDIEPENQPSTPRELRPTPPPAGGDPSEQPALEKPAIPGQLPRLHAQPPPARSDPSEQSAWEKPPLSAFQQPNPPPPRRQRGRKPAVIPDDVQKDIRHDAEGSERGLQARTPVSDSPA